jgi:uncharacterized protein with GYD domain
MTVHPMRTQDVEMSRYLFIADYSATGSKGLMAGGGVARREVVARAAKSVGGRLQSFDFAFGRHDAFAIVELPSHAAATKIALAINGSGSARVETVVLIDPADVEFEEMDFAEYRVPGDY